MCLFVCLFACLLACLFAWLFVCPFGFALVSLDLTNCLQELLKLQQYHFSQLSQRIDSLAAGTLAPAEATGSKVCPFDVPG